MDRNEDWREEDRKGIGDKEAKGLERRMGKVI
jgi:hypothetical protein